MSPLGEKEERGNPERLSKKVVLVANKADLPSAADHREILEELYGNRFPVVPVAANVGIGLEDLGRLTFRRLEILRAYTKTPGKEPDLDEPVVLPLGSTVSDFAEQIHKDFAEKLKFARIWGVDKHDGQRVHRDFPLTDGDVLELHT
jgi:ribosome-interacting GTPase 1